METPGKTQDGKIDAAVRYRFYYEKIWNVTITANSPKLGECIYSTKSSDKPLDKPQHPLVKVYSPTVQPHMCGSIKPYGIHTVMLAVV